MALRYVNISLLFWFFKVAIPIWAQAPLPGPRNERPTPPNNAHRIEYGTGLVVVGIEMSHEGAAVIAIDVFQILLPVRIAKPVQHQTILAISLWLTLRRLDVFQERFNCSGNWILALCPLGGPSTSGDFALAVDSAVANPREDR